MDVAVFGDVGGHARPFFKSLEMLGADPSIGSLPEGLAIVQLGDLIHKGKDSELIVNTVNKFIQRYPTRWVQLIGNHEMIHCPGGIQWKTCSCSPVLVKTLQDWWMDSQMRIGTVIKHPADDLLPKTKTLITHAGVTYNNWERQSHSPEDWLRWAEDYEFYHLCQATGLLYKGLDFNAGPLWAVCDKEVYASWESHYMSFNQVHGHTAPFIWYSSQWFNADREWRPKIKLHTDLRLSTYQPTPDSGKFIAIDQSYSIAEPADKFLPFLKISNALITQ